MYEYDNKTVLSLEQIRDRLKEFLNSDNYYNINKIILFGSYARGEAEKNSDIDLLVCDSPDFGGMKNFALIGDLKNIFYKEVELFIDRNIDKTSSFYNNIVNEGIVVYAR